MAINKRIKKEAPSAMPTFLNSLIVPVLMVNKF
jgi:hypothetical protein